MTENALFDAKLRDQVKRGLGIDDDTFDELIKRLQAEGDELAELDDGLNGETDISESPTDQARPERDAQGRFVNHPGPGRPRRQTEAAYARVLADVVSLDDWKEICQTTLQAAKAGDDKSRAFIARYVMGSEPMTLTALAIRDLADMGDDELVAAALALETDKAMEFYGDKDALQTALAQRADERREAAQREAQARAEAERERRRIEREARKAAKLAGDQAAQP